MLGRVQAGLRARRRLLVRVLVATAVLAAVVLVGRDWLATDRATERADDRVRETRQQLEVTRADHDAAVAEVEALRAALEADLATLMTRRDERAAAQGNADAAGAALADLQARLSASTVDLAASAGRLATLQECLVGVAEALNQAAAGDTNGLARTVRDIEGTCAAAGAEL
jgi:septal ring factor EnvC (AmiA/AmiB activator)